MSNESPFERYKDEVEYDYIISATMSIKLKGGNEDQKIESLSEFEEQINSLLEDEDYIKESFEEIGLGRVYCELSDIDFDVVTIKFGISLIDQEKEVKLEDLKADIKEFMKVLDSNIENFVSVSGLGGFEDPRDDYDPAMITLKALDKIELDVTKQPKLQESKYKELNDKLDELIKSNATDEEFNNFLEDAADLVDEELTSKEYTQLLYKAQDTRKIESVDLKNIDKKLVSEGKLAFKKEDKNIDFILTDDGIMELYKENKLVDSKPFSKLSLTRECKSIVQEGYQLIESEIKTSDNQTIDTDKEKANIEQAKKDVQDLQKAKQELEDEVDKLMEEKLEDEKIENKFPSTEFTQKVLTPDEINEFNPETDLTQEQIDWINNVSKVFNSIDDFQAGLTQFCDYVSIEYNIPLISIDGYINDMENM